jgi:uncharacterized protein
VPDGERQVIADTSPLQYLFQVGLINLLPSLYRQIAIPEAVDRELAAGRARGVSVPDPTAFSWIVVTAIREPAVLSLSPGLGPGEREALALAAQTSGSLLLVDDALARRDARLNHIQFTGTLGVLLKAKEAGHLPVIAPVLDQLDALHFRLASTTRATALRLAGEGP